MKLRTGILALSMTMGAAWAQNPDVIQNTQNTLQNVQKKQTIDQNAALAASGQGQSSAPASSPAAVTTPAKWAGSQSSASSSTPAKGNAPAAKQGNAAAAPVAAGKVPKTAAAPQSKPVPAPSTKAPVSAPATQPKAAVIPTTPKAKTPVTGQESAPAKVEAKPVVAASKPAQEKPTVAVEDKKNPVEPKKEPKEYSAAGRRDPFVSPVVNRMVTGSGCSSGKRCLAIDQIILTGIVKADSGMIAVVVNAMNKAYFLRENDPVFNGYVVRITGDSIIFSETLQDKLGKPFTREVTKKINTPAV